jgi:putative flippase GtrA
MINWDLLKTLVRCAGSSVAGVTIEFGLLTLLVSGLHVFYLLGALISSLVYLGISFLLNRHWAFRANRGALAPQLLRHGLVSGTSMALGIPMLWLLVNKIGLPYQLAWSLGGLFSFLAWTFPMQRWFTYRPAPAVEAR